MAKQPAKNSRVWFDHWRLDSGIISSTSLKFGQEVPLVTCLSDAGPRRLVGNYDHDGSHMGYFDGDDNLQDEFFWAAINDGDTDHYIVQNFTGGAIGEPAYLRIVRIAGQPRSAQLGGAVLLGLDEVGAGGAIRGTILGNKTSTGAENLTGQNMGATSSGTRFGVLFIVTAFTGTSVTMKLQESSDDGGSDAYADITGLTSGAISAAGHVYASTTAATEAYKRLNIAGTFSSATILVVAGTVKGT